MSKPMAEKPPIEALHPAPEKVERAWQSRGAMYALRLSPGDMTQCELESHLGRMVDLVLATRKSAEDAEMKALRLRWDEAEALEVISECRCRLGLPDGAIRDSASCSTAPAQEGAEAQVGLSPNSESPRGV